MASIPSICLACNADTSWIFTDAEGEPTHIVCGFLATAATSNPIFNTLPRLLTLPIGDMATLDWVEASMRFAAHELSRGSIRSPSIISKISELLLVEALRRFGETVDIAGGSLLQGLADPRCGKVLAMLHKEPQHQWSIDELARCMAMSKSAFVDRFTKLVGVPPIRYLTNLRMAKAKSLLRDTGNSVAEIAYQSGFESAVAFNRAFKRATGLPPIAWRNADGGGKTN